MQAAILAGGLGTRLLPRTERVPKSLIEVAGRPFIAWQLERLCASGFDSALLCVGHQGAQIRAAIGDGAAYGLSIAYSDDGERLLGTAGALRRALALLEPTFLVTYGDSFLPFDYAAPLRDLRAHPEALGTLAVYPNGGRWDASNTAVAGELVARYAKGGAPSPELDHIDYGAMALRREVVAALPPHSVIGLDRIQSELAAAQKLRAYVATERFYEIGSPSGLAELEALLSERDKP